MDMVMQPYYEREGITIYVGDNREVLPHIEPVHAVVTDPPYGLTQARRTVPAPQNDSPYNRHRVGVNGDVRPVGGFMGKEWDGTGIEQDQTFWQAMLTAMKPGAHLLSFGGTRTVHRIAVAIEDAGFEIRDTIAWMYATGFPKSHNLKGEWQGWGTALKPAHEPIIVARAPFKGTVAANVLEHGTGAINVDACRIGTGDDRSSGGLNPGKYNASSYELPEQAARPTGGRWPANVILDEAAAEALDAQSGVRRGGEFPARRQSDPGSGRTMGGGWHAPDSGERIVLDTGGASRFFYCAKSSRRERNAGLEGMPERDTAQLTGRKADSAGLRGVPELRGQTGNPYAGSSGAPRANSHPTVKPIALMRYLIQMVTPPGGIILDPFMGSGSTLVAAAELGFDAIGIELSEEYAEIAARRVDHALNERAGKLPLELAAD